MAKNSKIFSILAALLLTSCMGLNETDPSAYRKPDLGGVSVSSENTLFYTFSSYTGSPDRVKFGGFYYGKNRDMSGAAKIEAVVTSGRFSAEILLKDYESEYYVCSFISNGDVEHVSEPKKVTIGSLEDYVEFGDFTVDSYVSLTQEAEVSVSFALAEGVDVTSCGIYYGETTALSVDDQCVFAQMLGHDYFSAAIPSLVDGRQYFARPFIKDGNNIAYADVFSMQVSSVLEVETYEVKNVTDCSAHVYGEVIYGCGKDIQERGFILAEGNTNPTVNYSMKYTVSGKTGKFDLNITDLKPNTLYFVRAYAINSAGTSYGEVKKFTTAAPNLDNALSLAGNETANCYIVSESGIYEFPAVKGNSSTSVGSVSSVEVLWESFGTAETPNVGDLIDFATYSNGSIVFKVPKEFKEGNAVIAAKNSSGTILWSWHIWLTDQPAEQVYANNAGIMMDRNLGATSATPGDVGALGLLYQWGRKDPFLGSSSISGSVEAKSTGSWPSTVTSSSSNGTIAYATKNPMIFITYNDSNYDWYYTGSSSTDNTRWASKKTVYDPCPAGWRVPDGGSDGVWAKAGFDDHDYDDIDEGMLFGSPYSSPAAWYPASGYRGSSDGSLYDAGYYGNYWSVTPSGGSLAFLLYFYYYSSGVYPSSGYRASGQSVRCLKEGSSSETPVEPEYKDLSASGTANSYIISKSGDYKFKAVKGNSSTSVGTVASVEVLWESFGTSVTPSVGSLVKNVSYKDGYIQFSTPSTFKEGNAVIAAKNSSGTILWSWHIWLTDKPAEQVYANNAGTMMDRNLGATSATPGDVGALGLLYQWGRKDPFLGSSSISGPVEAKSTGSWPSTVTSSSSNGTIAYATKNPMTFITYNDSNCDWYYTGSSSTDNTRWASKKTVYDPCPAGWRVPDGGSDGVWAKAGFDDHDYDDIDEGMLFGSPYSSPAAWYPASGYRGSSDGSLRSAGSDGNYWSVTPYGYYAYTLYFRNYGRVLPSDYSIRAYGQSVRCLQE